MTQQHNMAREFFLGFIKIHILHHAAEEAVYGLALISELRRHGYELSPGKMYPVVNGKVRKYYAITRRGVAALADARAKIGELVGELLEADLGKRRAKATLPGTGRDGRRSAEGRRA
jgi:DNA-binding PadR family transcriptional regulator